MIVAYADRQTNKQQQHAVVRGGIHCITVRLRHTDGLSEANLAILEELYVVVKQLKGPLHIAGDWNLTPDVLASTQWLKMVGGIIFATQLPTCHSSTHSCFVLPSCFSQAVAGVQRIEDDGANPQFFARFLLRGDARRFAICKLIKGLGPTG